MFLKLFIICILLFSSLVVSQDCITYGLTCSLERPCCGGCCLNGQCKDTYLDCKQPLAEDPCKNRFCPSGQACVSYQPPGCKGCGPLTECRALPIPEELKKNETLTHVHLFSSSGCRVKISLFWVGVGLVLGAMIVL